MSEFLDRDRQHQGAGDNNGNNNELEYDPRCGMSKEVFEWRCRQLKRVDSRMPEVMRKMEIMTQQMRSNFLDDPEGLKVWDAYAKDVLYAYKRNLPYILSNPVVTPNSVLYEDLMKTTARSKTLTGMLSVGLDKLQTAKNNRMVRAVALAVGSAAVGFAIGFGCLKQQDTK